MSDNTVHSDPSFYKITVVTDETNVNVTQGITKVVQVNTPGPQGPAGGGGGGTTDISALNSFSASMLTFTGSIQAQVNSLTTATSSYVLTSATSSMIVSGALTASYYRETDPIFVAKSASFATTGSNTFVGNQIISGNLIPAGPYTNNTSSYNLGSPTAAWKDLYVSNGSVTFIDGASSASIKLSGSSVVFSGASVTLPTSSTVTTAATASYVNTLNQNLIVSGNFVVHNPTTGLDSINSDAYRLYDASGVRSVLWDDRLLKDNSDSNSVDWSGRILTDGTYTALDWQSRLLYANDAAPQLDWSNPDYIQLLNVRTSSISNVLGIDGGGRLYATASNALSVKTAETASHLNTLNQNLTLSGSLTVLNNLTVFGTQSIVYITSSQLDISTNLITVNTSTPAVRFGGIAVRDSGSLATGLTGSLLWDSQNDVWIYSNPSGAAYDGGLVIMGPRNTSGLGSEVGITSNALAKGNGSHHITSSQIIDNGTTVSIPGNLTVTGSIVGSLVGTASWGTNADTASKVTTNNDLAPLTMYLTYVRQTGSLVSQLGVSADLSYVPLLNTIYTTASNAITASYINTAVTASYVNTLNQDITINGTLSVSGEIYGLQGQVTALASRNYLFSGF